MVWWDPWNVTNRSNARYPLCCNYRHWIIITSDVMPKLELSATRKSTFTAPRVQICHHNRIPSRKGAARRSRNHKEKDRIMGRRNGLKWQHCLVSSRRGSVGAPAFCRLRTHEQAQSTNPPLRIARQRILRGSGRFGWSCGLSRQHAGAPCRIQVDRLWQNCHA